MDHDVKTLIGRRRYKVTCDEIKLFVGCRELVTPSCISRPKTSLTDGIGNVEIMELMGGSCVLKYRSHPCAICRRVRRKIQDNRNARFQQSSQMGPHRVLKMSRAADVISDGRYFAWIKPRQPMIFADNDGIGQVAKLGGKR
jgi:hypothetical protein